MTNAAHRLGLVSVSFRDREPEEILAQMKQAGLSCIEWGSDIHAPCRDRERLEALAVLQKRYGIVCSSYGTYFKIGKHDLSELGDYIEAAKLLGTDVLRIWCGRKSGAQMSEDEKKELLDECRRAAAIAEDAGVILCTECHQNTFTECAEDAVRLMECVASKHFRTYWQPFCGEDATENLARARKFAPYVSYLHVFNWQGEEKRPLAEATEDWRAYLGCFERPCTLLLEFMPHDRLDELSREATALKNIVGGSV